MTDSKTPTAVEALRQTGFAEGWSAAADMMLRLANDRRAKEAAYGYGPQTATPPANYFWCEEIAEAVKTATPALAGGGAEPVACPVCGNEERGQGGYLSCECPAPPDTALAEVTAERDEWKRLAEMCNGQIRELENEKRANDTALAEARAEIERLKEAALVAAGHLERLSVRDGNAESRPSLQAALTLREATLRARSEPKP